MLTPEALTDALFAAPVKDRHEHRTRLARALADSGTPESVLAFAYRCATGGPDGDGLDIAVDTLTEAVGLGLNLARTLSVFWAADRPDWLGRKSPYRWQSGAWYILLRAYARGCPNKEEVLSFLARIVHLENVDMRDSAVDALDDLHTEGARTLLVEMAQRDPDPLVRSIAGIYAREWGS